MNINSRTISPTAQLFVRNNLLFLSAISADKSYLSYEYLAQAIAEYEAQEMAKTIYNNCNTGGSHNLYQKIISASGPSRKKSQKV
jgi:hypothetical protein